MAFGFAFLASDSCLWKADTRVLKSVVDESLCIISPIKGTLWTFGKMADPENCLNEEGSLRESRRDNNMASKNWGRGKGAVVETEDRIFWKKRRGDAGREQLGGSRA